MLSVAGIAVSRPFHFFLSLCLGFDGSDWIVGWLARYRDDLGNEASSYSGCASNGFSLSFCCWLS